MKYRSKQFVVDAVQWYGPGDELPGVHREEGEGEGQVVKYYVVTIHGQRAYLAIGDWIITESDGVHHYPCKSDIFEAKYEPVMNL